MTHRGPFQLLPFCDPVILFPLRNVPAMSHASCSWHESGYLGKRAGREEGRQHGGGGYQAMNDRGGNGEGVGSVTAASKGNEVG